MKNNKITIFKKIKSNLIVKSKALAVAIYKVLNNQFLMSTEVFNK